MGTVSLEGMEFFARHGFYEEEQKLGNRYSVDITVETDMEAAAQHDDITGTVNYELLYQIVREEMETPARLLEHLANRIINRTYSSFPGVHSVQVSVSKFNPPVGGICERSRVTLKR